MKANASAPSLQSTQFQFWTASIFNADSKKFMPCLENHPTIQKITTAVCKVLFAISFLWLVTGAIDILRFTCSPKSPEQPLPSTRPNALPNQLPVDLSPSQPHQKSDAELSALINNANTELHSIKTGLDKNISHISSEAKLFVDNQFVFVKAFINVQLSRILDPIHGALIEDSSERALALSRENTPLAFQALTDFTTQIQNALNKLEEKFGITEQIKGKVLIEDSSTARASSNQGSSPPSPGHRMQNALNEIHHKLADLKALLNGNEELDMDLDPAAGSSSGRRSGASASSSSAAASSSNQRLEGGGN